MEAELIESSLQDFYFPLPDRVMASKTRAIGKQ
jgi:hypothetical protein